MFTKGIFMFDNVITSINETSIGKSIRQKSTNMSKYLYGLLGQEYISNLVYQLIGFQHSMHTNVGPIPNLQMPPKNGGI